MPLPTIENLKVLQARAGLNDTHVVYIGKTGFTIAHTDTERVEILLECCPLHTWLVSRSEPPAEVGYYTANLGDKWEFTPLDPSKVP